MSVVFLMAPAALMLAAGAIAAFIWAARDGQFDDVDTPPSRVLFDDAPLAKDDEAKRQSLSAAERDPSP